MLHGRRAEKVALDSLLARIDDGRSGVLILRGEPGVGKSALLHYLAEQAGRRVCLRSRGTESERDLPFAALHQLLRPIADRVPALPPPQRSALRTAFGLEDGHAPDPFLVGVAVLTLLGEASAGAGLICLLDDAQWLDSASLGALIFTSRRLEAEGVAIIFGVRVGTDDLLRSSDLPELALGALDEASAAGLLEERAPGINEHVRDAVMTRATGNPLALLEFLRSLTPEQLAGRDPVVEPLGSDSGVERMYVERCRGLPSATRTILLLAAAEGSGNLRIVLDAAALRGVTVAAFAPAEVAGMVRISQGGFEFRHPLVLSAVYSSASTGERLDAHGALVEAMQAAGEHWEDRRAWHQASASIGVDDEAAAALERSADRAIRRGGIVAASAALTRAAALSVDDASRARRLMAAADLAWRAGRPAQVMALLDAARPSFTEPEQHAAALFLAGMIELRSGMVDKSFQMLVQSFEAAVEAGAGFAVAALHGAGEAATATGDVAQLAEIGRLASSIAPPTPDDTVGLGMLIDGSRSIAGAGPASTTRMEHVLDVTETLSDPMQLQWFARAALYLCDERTALSIYSRAVSHARSTGAVGSLTPLLGRLAYCEFLAGRFTDAATSAAEAVGLARDIGQDVSYPLACLALVEGARGDEGACREHAGEVLALAVPRRSQLVAALGSWALGLLELGLGKPQLALDRLAGAGSYPHAAILRWSTPDLIEAAVRAGNIDIGRQAYTEFEKWAPGSRLPGVLAANQQCLGLLSDDVSHYREALVFHALAPRLFQVARTHLVLGESLRRQRARTESRPELRSAIERFERLGAGSWAERARTELRATGETSTKREPGAVQNLTAQELRISRLAAEGMRNQEIAEQLFLSSRTVEYHLHKVFAKLGISSRAELVRIDLESS